ncbi:adenylate/guanylate cyclase domain-containing protein [Nocardioides dongkuii]|uniref:adenylate/guanylate cyclase domain-containing protein n=1 Tax=Nocardioides dongkuii TaxID=2760089 RepID=UPI0015FAEB67|nr:adenylate/guanylate cyclase domain-containing protein [Nocardioides dongkuii]
MNDHPDREPGSPDLSGALEAVEEFLLGEQPSLTRVQVAEKAGVPLPVAEQLWRLLGFPHAADEDVAFTPADVQALVHSSELMELGILSTDRQAALVRTWGRSYARLAEWQTTLLTDVALEADDPVAQLTELAEQVLPRVESLQAYVWRRHLASAASRTLAVDSIGSPATQLAVCFVDIVGYTSHSKSLSEAELVGWIERFEDATTGVVADHGGRVIKNIGDEVLFVADDPLAAAEIALAMTARGADPDDEFPQVRAGLAYGEVVSRLGDVFGEVVNIASRLTSVARPCSVLVDRGAYEALSGLVESDEATDSDTPSYSFRRLRRTSVKGYARLRPWVLRRSGAGEVSGS